MSIEIRIAEKKDAPAIAALIKNHFESDYMGFAEFDGKYIADKMKKDFFMVAEADGVLVGCMRMALIDRDLAEIRTLCVNEPHRRGGIAQALLGKGRQLLEGKGVRKVIARVKAGNDEALRLFRRNSFEQEGYFREHYRKGIDVVQLARFL